MTVKFAALNAFRTGVESTISHAVRGFGQRRSRYIGDAKFHLQHLATVAAMNLGRMTEWPGGAVFTKTRRSKLRELIAQAA